MVRSFFDPSIFKQMMPKQGLSTSPVFDMKQMMETQRKNMQAMSDLVQLGMESVQQAMSRQAELVGRMVQDNSSYASTIIAEGTPEQKVQRQADMVRKSYEATVAGAREVNEILTKSSEEVAAIINRRVTASLSEFKAAFDQGKNAFEHNKAAATATVEKVVANAKPAAKKTARKAKAVAKAATKAA